MSRTDPVPESRLDAAPEPWAPRIVLGWASLACAMPALPVTEIRAGTPVMESAFEGAPHHAAETVPSAGLTTAFVWSILGTLTDRRARG
jgi:hypothetical protein